MRIQIREYIAFIKDFTERANIMTRTSSSSCRTTRRSSRAAEA